MDVSILKQITENVYSELTLADKNKESSFPYIRHTLPVKNSPEVEKILVLVIGGSVFKKAEYINKDGEFILNQTSSTPQPPFNSKYDFLKFCISEIDKTVTHIAINFAYPLNPIIRENRLDGVLKNGMKENRFDGLIGKEVGKEIEEFVFKKLNTNIKVYLANDTICLLLSGLGLANKSNLCAMVIGTGLNMSFFKDDNTCINTEAAQFDKFLLSNEVNLLDSDSVSPGKALFEKEIAGGYLYEQYNRRMKLLNKPFRHIYSTKELDIIASNNSQQGLIAKELLIKSAQYSACLLSGLVLFKKSDIVCNMEGSLFWNGFNYKSTFEQTLSKLVTKNSIKITKVKNSPLIGALNLIV